jgi:rubrerythrin
MPVLTTNRTSSSQSEFWRDHFARNLALTALLPWHSAPALSQQEREAIRSSIQQFQLGEGSSGRRLLDRARIFATQIGDDAFVPALALFVREEQRHSGQLLRFMEREGIPAMRKHWVDSVFRRLRVLAGLELSLRVLVTAEIIAVPYYRALGAATASPLLRGISEQILEDEAAHLRFQASMLARIGARRSHAVERLAFRFHRLFLLGTTCVVWRGHRKVFKAARQTYRDLLNDALAEFDGLERLSGNLRKIARLPSPAIPIARSARPQPSPSSSQTPLRASGTSSRNPAPR